MQNTFDLSQTINILGNTPKVLKALLSNLDTNWTDKNEGTDTWSPYDIIGHLIHGEKTDWIPRAKIILSDSIDKTFIPFDRFAQFENSIGKSLLQLLNEFEQLRNENIIFLRGLDLKDDQLNVTGIHPEFGEINLRQLLATWAVHDFNHLNQITRVMAKLYKTEAGPWKNYMKIIANS